MCHEPNGAEQMTNAFSGREKGGERGQLVGSQSRIMMGKAKVQGENEAQKHRTRRRLSSHQGALALLSR